jgi:LysR family transcriptional regulator, glycine cleavage system transcriptional activator
MRRALIPDIVTLQAFECAARHANFSRAAEELNLTQSAISRQIGDLEKQTGLRLFERIRQRVVLSEAGRGLLPEVRDLLQRSERLMIAAVASGRMGASLKVATLPTFGAKWLVPRLPDFMRLHPEVAVTIESRSKVFNFADENFDLAFHFGQASWAGGITRFLCSETVVPVASRGVAQKESRSADPFPEGTRLLHLTTRPKLWLEWSVRNGITLTNAFVGPRFDQFSMITSAAVAGLGIALLPSYLIEEELRSGLLVQVRDMPMSTDNAYYIVRPEAGNSQATTDLFERWVLSQIDEANRLHRDSHR